MVDKSFKNFKELRKDLNAYIEGFSQFDKMGNFIGAEVVSLNEKECVFAYQVNPAHFNPNGILHGGALYAVMDSSQGAFIHYILDDKFKFAATGTSVIKYTAPVLSGRIEIRTWLKNIDNRKYFIDSEAKDESGKVVATLEETWIAII